MYQKETTRFYANLGPIKLAVNQKKIYPQSDTADGGKEQTRN